MSAPDVMAQILDLARWAPSGDNTQPWRFEVQDGAHLVVHGSDTRTHCVYDLDGHPSQLSLGALIETISVAASGHGLRVAVSRRGGLPETLPTFDLRFTPDSDLQPSPLISAIPLRSVQRRPYSARALTDVEKQALEACLEPGYQLRWFEGLGPKWQMARLMFNNAGLRLTLREAFEVHRAIIHWGRRYSPDRVPDQALGADTLTLKLMRWAMQDWARLQFLNKWLAGTWAPRLQMDLLPGLLCGAHFVLLRGSAPSQLDDYVEAGRVVQRLWLTATALGLQHQPELTPLIFARYVREGRPFSSSPAGQALARQLADQSQRLIGTDLPQAVWIARIGQAPAASSRSVRRSRSDLTLPGPGRTV